MNARDPQLPLHADEASALGAFAARRWDEAIVPALTDYIAVPAKSPMFDAEWQAHGLIDRVVRDAAAWVEAEVGPCAALACVAAHLENPHPPETQNFDEWDAIVRTNLTGTFRTLTSFGKAMLERGAGSIVTIGSITAFNSSPLQAYGPTKAGIINMSRNFAVSWGRRGIRVNCVCPGPTRTPAVEASYARGSAIPAP